MNRMWTVASTPTGPVTVEHFRLVETPMPEPGPGHQAVPALRHASLREIRPRSNSTWLGEETWTLSTRRFTSF